MSRATPDLTQGFTGVSLPKTGPRQMGTDADGRTSVITFLNMVTESIASLHDNQSSTRPDYLPANGMWCYTAPDGTKTVYQYDGARDAVLWKVDTSGIATLFMMPQTDSTIKIVNGAMMALAAPLGDIQLKPFRPEDLVDFCPGWHFCNGDQYVLSTPVGQALNALPANLKSDFDIVVSGGNISIPNMFHADGRGYYLRAVNGTTRQAGSIETDRMRNLTGTFRGISDYGTGVFASSPLGTYVAGAGSNGMSINMDASRQVQTGPEFSVLDIGMTPAIFLGV